MSRIEQLIGAMTLSEKLGQMTMTAAPYAVTGPFVAGDLSEGIKSGAIGNLLNLYGPEIVAETQRLAVAEIKAGHSAADRAGCHSWPSHPVSGALGRGGLVRSRPVEGDSPVGGA